MSDSCATCNHDEHKVGQCKKCNCGESEIVHPGRSWYSLKRDFGDYINLIYNSPRVVRYEKGEYKSCR